MELTSTLYFDERFIRTKEDLNQDLIAVREWLRKQPHLPQNLDDRFLLNFLRGCKYSLEIFKTKLDMYFTIRAPLPEFFANRDVSRPELQEFFKYGYIVTLPTLTPEGRLVHLSGTTTTEFKTPDIADYFKLVTMMRDLRLHREETCTSGDIYILDARAAIAKHFLRVSPVTLKKCVICFTKAYPTILKEVHLINFNSYISTVINAFKPLLKEKILNRVHFHHDLESLHKFVPKEIFPEEFGGSAGKLDDYREKSLKYLSENAAWFKEQEKIVADESKRVVKQNCCEDLFGLDGSFRQLSID